MKNFTIRNIFTAKIFALTRACWYSRPKCGVPFVFVKTQNVEAQYDLHKIKFQMKTISKRAPIADQQNTIQQWNPSVALSSMAQTIT